jgi:hypothetical protein
MRSPALLFSLDSPNSRYPTSMGAKCGLPLGRSLTEHVDCSVSSDKSSDTPQADPSTERSVLVIGDSPEKVGFLFD